MNAAATRAQWIRQNEAVHANLLRNGGKAGVWTPTVTAGRSGLATMQAWLTGESPYPHICDTLDFALVEVDAGRTVFQGTPQLNHASRRD